ncbi:MAG: extracellular solute-binding protein [Pseudomonadota bacterium]|nr:extracellular solute-binding protein [Pseudomonadota bacterium]
MQQSRDYFVQSVAVCLLSIQILAQLLGYAFVGSSTVVAAAQKPKRELNIYTSRSEHLLKPILARYTKETGVKFRYLTDKAPVLIQKLLAEGKNTKADILMTVDAGNLWHAAQEDLLVALKSPTIATQVPVHLRANNWTGLSIRARSIVYDSRKVSPSSLSTYKDLGSAKWRGKLCLRTSQKVYNRSLVAMLIGIHGHDETKAILKSWVNNLATVVLPSDTKVIEAIKAGQCAVGVVNSYYLARLQKKDPNYPVKIFWANQQSTGVHINISGAGIVRHSRNKQLALAFLEWIVRAQSQFAELNMEFPINTTAKAHPLVAAWGDFKASDFDLARIGKLQPEAVRVIDMAGYH